MKFTQLEIEELLRGTLYNEFNQDVADFTNVPADPAPGPPNPDKFAAREVFNQVDTDHDGMLREASEIEQFFTDLPDHLIADGVTRESLIISTHLPSTFEELYAIVKSDGSHTVPINTTE